MSSVLWTSDLHFSHKSLLPFRSECQNRVFIDIHDHDQWLIDLWNKQVKKRDLVWVLGDVAWTDVGLHCLAQCNGTKHLVMGNHDKFQVKQYLRYFNKIYGVTKRHGAVLSHVPIHPLSLEFRWKYNIHGHIHHKELDKLYDNRYINVNIDVTGGKFLTLEELIRRIGNNAE